MNPVDHNTAKAAAGRLLDDRPASMPNDQEVHRATTSFMGNMVDTNYMLRELEATPTHLRALRAMFAAELTGKAREQVLLRIAKVHGELLAEVNLQGALHHLPTLAVYAEKRRPNS